MILNGDVREMLDKIESNSVQTCITSPPYWNLRDYESDTQLGMEDTPQEFASSLVKIFDKVKRVLRKDGTLWLNLGDTYFGAKGGHWDGGNSVTNDETGNKYRMHKTAPPKHEYLKTKDLVGVPWMVAFALQQDGWYLRNDIIWAKPNGMPEAVKDRCSKSHEHIFLFAHPESKGKYYFDYKAIQIDVKKEHIGRYFSNNNLESRKDNGEFTVNKESQKKYYEKWQEKIKQGEVPKKNKRDVWHVPTSSFKGAHFAVFPSKLILPCIMAGSKEGDTVLDIFAGSGTTCKLAQRLSRKWIGIELNPKYAEIIKQQTSQQSLF